MRVVRLLLFFLVFLCLVANQTLLAQKSNKDLRDLYSEWKNDTLTNHLSQMAVGKTYTTFLPIVGYNPAYGFLAGSSINFTRLLGKKPTNPSSLLLTVQYTSRKQLISNLRSKIYMKNNRIFMQGDWRFLLFSQTTYGLGINNSEYNKGILPRVSSPSDLDVSGEPMNYNMIRFYEDIAFRLGQTPYYAGLGIAVDQHFGIEDRKLDTTIDDNGYYLTSHYNYSVKNNYNLDAYGANGIKFSIIADTRDHIINTYKGYFGSVSLLQNLKIGQNSKSSRQIIYDVRYFYGLSRQNQRHVLAYWGMGSFLLSGHVPYLALPSIGWDTYNRSGRGFVQGRYRGINLVYNEAEYRFPVSKNNLIGGILFVNTIHASSYYQKLFDKTAIGYGAGLRLQLDKRSRTNLTIDYGFGSNRSSAVFINLQETF